MGFNTQPPEGGWYLHSFTKSLVIGFQHTAARRRLGFAGLFAIGLVMFQHTAARRRLGHLQRQRLSGRCVSTHSRPKAAGGEYLWAVLKYVVSTHSRPKAAGAGKRCEVVLNGVSTHSRPKAAGIYHHLNRPLIMLFQHTAARRRLGLRCVLGALQVAVSTHSRPKAAGGAGFNPSGTRFVSTHSRPKAAGHGQIGRASEAIQFQHTAARRRLGNSPPCGQHGKMVSTHSRPKAAGCSGWLTVWRGRVSTHSRPKAAGFDKAAKWAIKSFQHTAARRRLGAEGHSENGRGRFNTQPPEGGWHGRWKQSL